MIAVNGAYPWLVEGTDLAETVGLYVVGDGIRRDAVLALIAALLGTSIIEVGRLHNPGDLVRFLMGRYRFPEEETRVFLFADLEDSTGLAERLGDLLFARLIGDLYRDMSEPILAWRGQVYQYVGDEVIVSWPFGQAVQHARCIRCFFEMNGVLVANSHRYQKRYGTVPRFRVGIHEGPVVTTWLGEAKTDLAFLGDTLNATARIQAECKRAGVRCIISETMVQHIDLPEGLQTRSLGKVELRGKDEVLELLSIEIAGPPPPEKDES